MGALRMPPGAALDLRHESALADPRALCTSLGLLEGPFTRQASGFIVRCPWHDERTPSCSVRVARDGTVAARCHGCGASGDALTFIAAVHGLDMRRDFREVLRIAADLAGRWDLLDPTFAAPPRPPPRVTVLAPERDYPRASELGALWAACGRTSDDDEVAAALAARGLDAERVDDLDLARALPREGPLPRWARYQGRSWQETGHRLVFPVYDATGAMRSVRVSRTRDDNTPKRLPPGGYRASGLVLADPFAVAILACGVVPGETPDQLRVVIAEGEPDFLTWATRASDADADAFIVLGLVSGAWTPELAARIPDGAQVTIRTDHDLAGDKYAEAVRASLVGRCRLSRTKRPEAA